MSCSCGGGGGGRGTYDRLDREHQCGLRDNGIRIRLARLCVAWITVPCPIKQSLGQICGRRAICAAGMCPRVTEPSPVASESGVCDLSVVPAPAAEQTLSSHLPVFFHDFVGISQGFGEAMVGGRSTVGVCGGRVCRVTGITQRSRNFDQLDWMLLSSVVKS